MVSKVTKATVAMKMNITFCSSSVPNQMMVSGTTAAMGTLRKKTTSGAMKAPTRRKVPARMPRGRPTMMARPKPSSTRVRLIRVWRPRPNWVISRGKRPKTSPGLGTFTGDTRRSSAPSP